MCVCDVLCGCACVWWSSVCVFVGWGRFRLLLTLLSLPTSTQSSLPPSAKLQLLWSSLTTTVITSTTATQTITAAADISVNAGRTEQAHEERRKRGFAQSASCHRFVAAMGFDLKGPRNLRGVIAKTLSFSACVRVCVSVCVCSGVSVRACVRACV